MGTDIWERSTEIALSEHRDSTCPFLPELYIYMSSPEDEARKKAADAKPREAEKPHDPAHDAMNFVGQLVGDARNLAMDAVSGTHSGDQVLSSITPALAAQYQRGKEIQERIARTGEKENSLSPEQRKDLHSFNDVRKSMSHVPLYDRDSLLRYVEKGIEQKARSSPRQDVVSHPAGKQEVGKQQAATSHETSKGRETAKLNSETIKPGLAKPADKSVADKPLVERTGSDKPRSEKPIADKLAAEKPVAEKSSAEKTNAEKLVAGSPAQDRSVYEKAAADKLLADKLSAEKTVANKPSLSGSISEKSPQPQEKNTFDKALPQKVLAEKPMTEKTTSERSSAERNTPEKLTHQQLSPDRHITDRQLSEKEKLNDRAIESRPSSEPKQSGTNRDIGSVFEKRTTSGDKGPVDAKQILSNRVADEVQPSKQSSESKPVNSQSLRETIAQDLNAKGSFQDMRRVLEARTTSHSKEVLNDRQIVSEQTAAKKNSLDRQSSKHPDAFEKTIKTQSEKQPEERVVNKHERQPESASKGDLDIAARSSEIRSMQRSTSSEGRRVSLAEIKETLTNRQVELVSQISAERFPAGLNWQTRINSNESKIANTGAGSGAGAIKASIQTSDGIRKPDATSKAAGLETFSMRGKVQDRYITGAEIALAAIIAAAGAKRLRHDEIKSDGALISPVVQRLDAFQPDRMVQKDTRQVVDAPSSFARAEKNETKEFTIKLQTSEKRFITGAEIAIAAVISSAGTAKLRHNLLNSIKADNTDAVEDPGDETERSNSAKSDSANSATDALASSKNPYIAEGMNFRRKSILLNLNDTLVTIAENYFHQGRYAWLIADINKANLKETFVDGKRIVELHSRQAIELPSSEELSAFVSKKGEHNPADLITIVIETQVDRELLDSHLGVFVDDARKVSLPAELPNPGTPAFARTAFGADGTLALPQLNLGAAALLKLKEFVKRSAIRREFR